MVDLFGYIIFLNIIPATGIFFRIQGILANNYFNGLKSWLVKGGAVGMMTILNP